MKFGDKLIKLRKEKGLSQEELAEKLNVSRQSVSKWESNNTYPETDKIVQICNIFDCSMDDLINDKILDITKREAQDKKKYQIIVDSFLDFIIKTVNLFSSMKFLDILKCLFELAIITIILIIGGCLFIGASEFIFNNIFSFLNGIAYHILNSFIEGLFTLIWLILSIIIITHIFKIRYLNYYDEYLSKMKKEEPSFIVKNNKTLLPRKTTKEKIIFRDEGNTPLAFLTILSKIAMGMLKVFGIFLLVGAIFILFGLVVSLMLFISLAIYSDIFKGISLGLFGIIVLGSIIIYLLGSFILNKKIALKVTIISFILAFLITALGTGLALLSLKDIEFKEQISFVKKKEFKETLSYEDKMFIDFSDYLDSVNYIIDNNMTTNDILITANYDSAFHNITLHKNNYYHMLSINVHSIQNTHLKDVYEKFINDLKRNVISDYASLRIEELKIYANEETINKLLDNYAKIYTFDTTPTTNGYKITIKDKKVTIDNYYCRIDYDIYNDSLTILEEGCLCDKEVLHTGNDNKTIYNCRYDE